jgi:hypothetical protein
MDGSLVYEAGETKPHRLTRCVARLAFAGSVLMFISLISIAPEPMKCPRLGWL